MTQNRKLTDEEIIHHGRKQGASEAQIEAAIQKNKFRPVLPFERPSRKIGRNEPCPCGSGQKFKKCHMAVKDNPKVKAMLEK